ncbi:MAG: VanZ family protein [candidate division WOR-3 bacterium]
MKKIPFLIWLLVIITVTSLPQKTFLPSNRGLDKVFHFFLYSTLTLFFFLGFDKKSWKYLIFIVIFAGIDEIHQYLIGSRTPSFYDFLSNFSGIIFTFLTLK